MKLIVIYKHGFEIIEGTEIFCRAEYNDRKHDFVSKSLYDNDGKLIRNESTRLDYKHAQY